MSGFLSSPENGQGSALDRLALFCALVTLVCVLGAHGMDQLAQNGELPKISWARAEKHPGVDHTATATISTRASSVAVNPCGQN
jgi:hypothetical protein